MSALIVTNELKKSFAKTGAVLKGISFSANEGDVVAILGASGSGKSTFLRCLNLLEVPDSGEMTLLGEPVIFHDKKGKREVDKAQIIRLRQSISMVFQQFNLWSHMSVLQNVTEALLHVLKMDKQQAHQHARDCLEKVGMLVHQDKFPNQLSGGQKQRVAIARSLAMRPQVILFDEPTSALDPELVQEVLAIITQLANEHSITMLVVTHEMAFAKNVSNKTLFLHEGKVECFGDTHSVFTDSSSAAFKKFIQHFS